MTRRTFVSPVGRASILALGLALLLTTHSSADSLSPSQAGQDKLPSKTSKAFTKPGKTQKSTASKTKRKRPHAITNPKFDPKAKRVEMFAAQKDGSIKIQVFAENSFGGSLFFENRTKQPLTVEVPDSFVAVNRQFGGGMGGMGGGMGGRGGMGGGMGGQMMGGGMGGMGGGMMGGMGGGMMGGGMGMMSIPPEKTVKMPFNSVCLEHGKAEPDITMTYSLFPVSQFTNDEQLTALLSLVGTRAINSQVAQAAAWHLASKMSWDELASKESTVIGASDLPYFSFQELYQAQLLIAQARGLAKERAIEREKKGNTNDATPKPASDRRAFQNR